MILVECPLPSGAFRPSRGEAGFGCIGLDVYEEPARLVHRPRAERAPCGPRPASELRRISSSPASCTPTSGRGRNDSSTPRQDLLKTRPSDRNEQKLMTKMAGRAGWWSAARPWTLHAQFLFSNEGRARPARQTSEPWQVINYRAGCPGALSLLRAAPCHFTSCECSACSPGSSRPAG